MSSTAVLSDAVAEIVLPCPEFDATLTFFRETLGFRLNAIFPADDPAIAQLSGHGLNIRLDRYAAGNPAALQIASDRPDEVLGGAAQVTAPNGSLVSVVPIDPPLVMPPVQQTLTLRTLADSDTWGVGRAGMLYRDLIPAREGGRFIASHIRIPDGGPVPDNVHFHKIRFQMIYTYKGWVRLMYEDQGEPFVMQAGDCVLQPPEIRHRVLECSDGLEVIEIGCPADHMTLLDHDLELPTGRTVPDRDFGGQRFVWHQVEKAVWEKTRYAGFERRDLGIKSATDGLAQVSVLRPTNDGAVSDAAGSAESHSGEFLFYFVLEGAVSLMIRDDTHALSAGDSVTIPADTDYRLINASVDLEFLEVRLPAERPKNDGAANGTANGTGI